MSKPFEQQQEETLAYLELERGRWLNARKRADRADGFDGIMNRTRDESMGRLNKLLEEYFSQIVMMEAFSNV